MAFEVAVRESMSLNYSDIDLQQYLSHLESLYTRWHPTHQRFTFIKKTPGLVGSQFSFQEKIAGVRVLVKGRVTRSSPTAIFWESETKLIRIAGSIQLSEGMITQEVSYRVPGLLYAIGKRLGKIVTREQLATHVREELQQMCAIISKHQ